MTQEKNNSRKWLNAFLITVYVVLIILLLLRSCEKAEQDRPEVEVQYDAVDMVMCIDATGSMEDILNTITSHASAFCHDLKEKCLENGKDIEHFRVRVIAFRDLHDHEMPPMEDSGFFNLPSQERDYRRFLSRLVARGGGDEDESGLDALAKAMDSPWTTSGASRCKVIMLWTNAETKPLASDPRSLPDLKRWWDTEKMGDGAKRMVLFAPSTANWSQVATWDDVSISDGYSDPRNYDAILDAIVEAL